MCAAAHTDNIGLQYLLSTKKLWITTTFLKLWIYLAVLRGTNEVCLYAICGCVSERTVPSQ